MSKVYSDQIRKTTDLAKGISKNLSLLKGYGLSEKTAADLEKAAAKAQEYDDKKDKMREELHAYTVESNEHLDKMKQMVTDAKKIIKLNFPQERWSSFGIPDQK